MNGTERDLSEWPEATRILSTNVMSKKTLANGQTDLST